MPLYLSPQFNFVIIHIFTIAIVDRIKIELSVAIVTNQQMQSKYRIWIRSFEGLTLETSAFESLYAGQFTLSTQLVKPHYLFILPTDVASQFLKKFTPPPHPANQNRANEIQLFPRYNLKSKAPTTSFPGSLILLARSRR